MNDKEKLKIACDALRLAIRNGSLEKDFKSKWIEFGLRGSVQTRNARTKQNSLKRYLKEESPMSEYVYGKNSFFAALTSNPVFSSIFSGSFSFSSIWSTNPPIKEDSEFSSFND